MSKTGRLSRAREKLAKMMEIDHFHKPKCASSGVEKTAINQIAKSENEAAANTGNNSFQITSSTNLLKPYGNAGKA